MAAVAVGYRSVRKGEGGDAGVARPEKERDLRSISQAAVWLREAGAVAGGGGGGGAVGRGQEPAWAQGRALPCR